MPVMDIAGGSATLLEAQPTPPIQIGTPVRRPVQGAPIEDMPIPKLDHDAIRATAKKRRKNKKKAMLPAAPASKVVRGFQTPVTSGGEESDISAVSTPRLYPMKDGPMVNSSPALRPSPSQGGLSALRLKLDQLALDPERKPSLARVLSNESAGYTGQATPSSRGSDGDRTEMETYDVPLYEDFVSADAGTRTPLFASQAVEGGLRLKSIHRKMCANDFENLRCLGKGAFGTVHLVKQRNSGRLFAQKQFKKASLTVHKRLVEQTRTERHILESINRHAFVVKLYYAFQDQEKLYLILEYAQGGELFHHLKMERMLPESTASFYMAEMILALEHLHHNVRVIYRDLKPENCLLDAEGHLLLTDFGLSKVAIEEEGERANSVLGTIEYMAPEVIKGEGYDFAVDWWSLGAIGYDLLTGSPPFGGNNHAKIQQNILKQKLKLPYFLGPDAKDLLTRLLRKEPEKRLGGTNSKDLKGLKSHRFFNKIDWKKLEKRQLEPPIQPVITDPELAENFDEEFTGLALSPVVTRDTATSDELMQESQILANESNREYCAASLSIDMPADPCD